MPLDEAAGCLVGVFRFFAVIAELILDLPVAEPLGWVGKWTLYVISLGHWNRNSDDVVSILAGLLVCVGLITLGAMFC